LRVVAVSNWLVEIEKISLIVKGK